MTRPLIRAAFCSALALVSLGAAAQSATDLKHAQQRYDRQIAHCNSGKLPAPEREACVRQAGAALDKARGGPPASSLDRNAHRRSSVVVPEGASVPQGSSTQRSSDGRSTVVVPNPPARQP